MKNFTKEVLGLNPGDQPMIKSDFHSWMLAQTKLSSRQLVAIPLYLESLGFEKGRDVIDSGIFDALGYIHSNYWWVRNKARPVSHPVGYYSLVDNGD
jgi:hypothetical protein